MVWVWLELDLEIFWLGDELWCFKMFYFCYNNFVMMVVMKEKIKRGLKLLEGNLLNWDVLCMWFSIVIFVGFGY